MNIFERVAAWNEARYPQEFNKALQLSLLREELQELLDATTEVDALDALCDISFVALGGLWKGKLEPSVDENVDNMLAQHFNANDSDAQSVIKLQEIFATFEAKEKLSEGDIYIVNTAAYLFAENLMHERLNLDMHRQVIALSIVCDSNDSKAVKRTAPGVKANIDKGAGFVPPEARLQSLLDTRWTGA